MPKVEILKSHSLKELRSQVSKTNIKKYSKLRKADLIELMLKKEHLDLFHHMELKTHKMPGGKVMTGSEHTEESVVVAPTETKNKTKKIKLIKKKDEEKPKKKIKMIKKPKRKEIKVTTFETGSSY